MKKTNKKKSNYRNEDSPPRARFWRSVEFRLRLAPFIALGLGVGLSIPCVWFMNEFQLLSVNEGQTRLAMTLYFAAVISIVIHLVLIPFILGPLKAFNRRLMSLEDRSDIKRMNPDEFPDFEVTIRTMQDYIRWADKQTSLASMIHQAIREKAQKAERDTMTGLYNKAYLYNFLPEALARCQAMHQKISLLMIDIDHFKNYNDTNGHPAGDKVLIRTAQLLQASVRDHDVCVRFGGEEFIVVLPNSSTDRAYQIAERLRQSVERIDFEHGEHQPLGRVTISIGLATFPDHALSMETLIERADKSLYQSKNSGRNRVSINDEPVSLKEIDEDFDIEVIDTNNLERRSGA